MLFRQWLVVAGPFVQSRGPVPKLASSCCASGVAKMVCAFSGKLDAATFPLPPPMYRQARPRSVSGVVWSTSEKRVPEKGGSPGANLVPQFAVPGELVNV